jgi:hypothetical protein
MWGKTTKQRKSAQRRHRRVGHAELMREEQEAARLRRAAEGRGVTVRHTIKLAKEKR